MDVHPEPIAEPEPENPIKKKKKKKKKKRNSNPENEAPQEPENQTRPEESTEVLIQNLQKTSKREVDAVSSTRLKSGWTCFLCNGTDHIPKFCPLKSEWFNTKICVLCRKRGHSIQNCFKSNGELKNKNGSDSSGEGHEQSKSSKPLQVTIEIKENAQATKLNSSDGLAKHMLVDETCNMKKGNSSISNKCEKRKKHKDNAEQSKKQCLEVGVSHLAQNFPEQDKEAMEIEARPKVTKLTSDDSLVEENLTEDKCDVNRGNSSTSKKRERRKRYKENLKQRKKLCLESGTDHSAQKFPEKHFELGVAAATNDDNSALKNEERAKVSELTTGDVLVNNVVTDGRCNINRGALAAIDIASIGNEERSQGTKLTGGGHLDNVVKEDVNKGKCSASKNHAKRKRQKEKMKQRKKQCHEATNVEHTS